MHTKLLSKVAEAIAVTTRQQFELLRITAAGGGDISQTFRLEGKDGRCFFLKLNEADRYPMFTTEAAGLETLTGTGTLRVPQPVTHGCASGHSYLVLEHLDLAARGDARLLGEQLAALHRCTTDRFGFARDNFIGRTPQPNRWEADWVVFWREQRLGFQLRLAVRNGYGSELQEPGARLMEALPALFAGHTPQPSLLHGDLWGGNHGFLGDGTPVVFDPAAYYGDRECDLAMTELFGGYPAEFHAGYRSAWPLDSGYALRRDLYNLYHLLNHANLFGGGYVGQARQGMVRLLQAVS